MYFFPLKFVSVGCRHHKTLPRVSSRENNNLWASVVVQWLRIHLAMQGTPIPSLVQEDSTWLSAAKPIRSVQFSHSVMSSSLQPHELQHSKPPCPSPTPGVYSNSCPLSQWCHPTIWSSVVPFSSRLQSFPASGSFQMRQFFFFFFDSVLRIRWPKYWLPASTSVLPMNIQDWFPLRWTGWISLQCKGLSRVFSNTTVQKHQFFSTQLSL